MWCPPGSVEAGEGSGPLVRGPQGGGDQSHPRCESFFWNPAFPTLCQQSRKGRTKAPGQLVNLHGDLWVAADSCTVWRCGGVEVPPGAGLCSQSTAPSPSPTVGVATRSFRTLLFLLPSSLEDCVTGGRALAEKSVLVAVFSVWVGSSASWRQKQLEDRETTRPSLQLASQSQVTATSLFCPLAGNWA